MTNALDKLWKPNSNYVDPKYSLPGLNYSAANILLAAGPPRVTQINSASFAESVYPIGGLQSVTLSMDNSLQQLFEIGSDRSVFYTGRTLFSIAFARTLYYGPSLLRVLYAAYDFSAMPYVQSTYKAANLLDKAAKLMEGFMGSTPLANLSDDPGSGIILLNMASDLFKYPHGLACLVIDPVSGKKLASAFYLENCMVPSLSFGFDAHGIIVSEATGIRFERMIPISVARGGSASLAFIEGLEDKLFGEQQTLSLANM